MCFWCGFVIVPWYWWLSRLCDDLVMWPWVRFLDLKWYWIFYGLQWIICSFIVTLRSLVLQYVYHSCHDVKEIYFAKFKWKFPNFSMSVKCSLSWNLHFPHPINYVTYWAYLIPLFYKIFHSRQLFGGYQLLG